MANHHRRTFATATADESSDPGICRIAVVASSLPRLQKVFSFLSTVTSNNNDNDDNNEEPRSTTTTPTLQYLPCTAQFGRYRNEEGQAVLYLVQVNYHPELALVTSTTSTRPIRKPPQTLLELIDSPEMSHQKNDNDVPDNNNNNNNNNNNSIPLIAGIMVGAGLDDRHGTAVSDYFVTLLSSSSPNSKPELECLSPNQEFATMADEFQYFQSLSTLEKQQQSGVLGPSKMAQHAHNFAQQMQQHYTIQPPQQQSEPTTTETQLLTNPDVDHNDDDQSSNETPDEPSRVVVDPTQIRYACRMCRHVLFGQDHLQSHVPSQHSFAHHRQQGNNSNNTLCQSYFVKEPLHWMMDDTALLEGKLFCPSCQAKVGSWNWSGAQCSCGTWVVPAWQFPVTKLDGIEPLSESNGPSAAHGTGEWPPGTILPRVLSTVPPAPTRVQQMMPDESFTGTVSMYEMPISTMRSRNEE